MFGASPKTQVHLCDGTTDLRRSFEGLSALVQHKLKADPLSGHLFVFANRSRSRIKVLYWDGSGLWVCTKRLEQGTFRWPEKGGVIDMAALQALLSGYEIRTRKGWYRHGTPVLEPL